MANAVFTTKVTPTYDDVPELRYHFPRTYLRQVQAAVGDWFLYYEPRRESAELSGRAGRQVYFAMARVQRIADDPKRAGHYYAYVSDYLEFTNPVPFRVGQQYYESALQKPDGSTNRGAFGRAVRNVPPVEFAVIVARGFADEASPPLAAEPIGDPALQLRERALQVTTRVERDRAFFRQIRSAYDSTCAMTGLRLVSGNWPEVEAAHIRPVGNGHDGPDSPRNGVALSRTMHWMFDRGLVSIDDEYRILIAQGRVPPIAGRLFRDDHRLVKLPGDAAMRPHPAFLKYHRDNIFLG